MAEPISDLSILLRTLEPHLHAGVYVYSSVPVDTDLSGLDVIGTFRETEGLSIILPEHDALGAGFPILFRAAWITLTVTSALGASGLTAAVSTSLADAGISCNIVAGASHDHLFVPIERAGDAMAVIVELSKMDW